MQHTVEEGQRVLIIGYVWPEPSSSAAGSRMMQLIRLFLGVGWSVTFASAAQRGAHRADIESLGVDAVDIELNSSSFDEFVVGVSPTIVLFDRFMIEEQFGWRVAEHCPSALRVLDTEDLHSLRSARQQALKSGGEVSREQLNSELAMREVASILRCDLSLIISEYEMALLQDHYRVDEALLWHLPFMLSPVVESGLAPFQERQGYISIGNFRHAPNWDAVLYLKQKIWPSIRSRQPDAQLSIYGAYPPPKATRLHKPSEGFFVEGWADDACEVMRAARICLAPLRFGAGLKGKLVDAMCSGTPSVTTAIGAEAMHADLPWGGAIADEPEKFASYATSLYEDRDRWQQAQRDGANIINRLYDERGHGRHLIEKIRCLLAGLREHRLDNFAGAMLQHHTLQSTRYMAQWIEVKNLFKTSR